MANPYQASPVLVYGHPDLRGIAKAVPSDYPRYLLRDHANALLQSATGGTAIAASQIGLGLRLFIIKQDPCFALNATIVPEGSGALAPKVYPDKSDDPTKLDDYAYATFINPYFTDLSSTSFDVEDEGCLSIPRYYKGSVNPAPTVKRYTSFQLHYLALTSSGIQAETKVFNIGNDPNNGALAALRTFCWLVQHETDHLDGKFFIDQLGAPSASNVPPTNNPRLDNDTLNAIKAGSYDINYATLPKTKA